VVPFPPPAQFVNLGPYTCLQGLCLWLSLPLSYYCSVIPPSPLAEPMSYVEMGSLLYSFSGVLVYLFSFPRSFTASRSLFPRLFSLFFLSQDFFRIFPMPPSMRDVRRMPFLPFCSSTTLSLLSYAPLHVFMVPTTVSALAFSSPGAFVAPEAF